MTSSVAGKCPAVWPVVDSANSPLGPLWVTWSLSHSQAECLGYLIFSSNKETNVFVGLIVVSEILVKK